MSRNRSLPFAWTAAAIILIASVVSASESQQVTDANCPLSASRGTTDPGSPSARAEPPTLQEVGQDTFAAVAEMVRRLETDPNVEWSTVRLDRLREHLIDMDRVMSQADVDVTDLPDGFRARVSSSDPRSAAAIGRMVPAHSHMMNGHRGWRVSVASLEGSPAGVVLEVQSAEPDEAERLKALGFSGFLVAGDHHRPHHLAMTLGGDH